VALQFGMYYVHYVHDCFSILQYVAHNRFVYDKMGSIRGGYAGGDPVRDSVRGQGCGVTVDSLQILPVDSGDEGCRHQRIRQRLSPKAKFVAVRAQPRWGDRKNNSGGVDRVETALYPGVDAERALMLTSEYLFDAYRLVSDRERVYDWHAQGAGQVRGADQDPWKSSADLNDNKFWAPSLAGGGKVPDPVNVRRKDAGDAAWAEALVSGADDKTVGVRVSMLPEKGTSLFTFAVPGVNPTNNATLMARRTAPSTVFVALHEPFRGGPDAYRVVRFERIAQNDQGLAVAVVGKDGSGMDDRILLRYGDEVEKPLTLEGGGESFTFSDSAFVRVGRETVTVEGPLTAMKVKAGGAPKLVANGKEKEAMVAKGFLEMGK
jgi:hypothetical protein